MDKGASLRDRAGGLRPEPPAASQPEALIPSADATPRTADVYTRTMPAAKVMADAVGCDIDRAMEIIRSMVEGGYFIAPRVPTDPMLYAYFSAYGSQAWSPRTIIQNIGKARLRWQAMGQAGTDMAFSRKFLTAQGTPTRSAETEGLGPKDGGPVTEGDAPETTQVQP